MLQSLQLLELADFSAVIKVANFATLVSTYLEGNNIIILLFCDALNLLSISL